MIIGVFKEIKLDEYCVFMLFVGVEEFVCVGYIVLVEVGVGFGFGLFDYEYLE